jgi:Fur family zinc uptake transcriptional regulator
MIFVIPYQAIDFAILGACSRRRIRRPDAPMPAPATVDNALTPRRPLSRVQERILALLAQATKPMSAYDLLALLREEGVNAPPTVYRALDRLMRDGLAHRIESLNAFVACCEPDHAHLAGFMLCDTCGQAAEFHDHGLEHELAAMAERRGFALTRMMVELRGQCPACRGVAPSAAGCGHHHG